MKLIKVTLPLIVFLMSSGIIMEAAVASQRAVYAETREKTLRYTVQLIDKYLLVQREHKTGCLVR